MEDRATAIVQSFYAAMAMDDVQAVLALASPSIVVTQTDRLPWGGRFEGRDGLARFAAGVRTHIASRVTIDRYVSAGSRVAAIGWTAGTAIAGGRAFDVPLVHLFTIEDGVVVSLEVIADAPQLSAALGALNE